MYSFRHQLSWHCQEEEQEIQEDINVAVTSRSVFNPLIKQHRSLDGRTDRQNTSIFLSTCLLEASPYQFVVRDDATIIVTRSSLASLDEEVCVGCVHDVTRLLRLRHFN